MKSIEVELNETELVFIADKLQEEIAETKELSASRHRLRRLQRFFAKINDALNQIEREES